MNLSNLVNILDYNSAAEMCDDLGAVFRLVGIVILALKIAVVIVLIVMGVKDFFLAAAEKDEKTMKEAQKKFITRLITAALVYFVPLVVTFLMKVIGFSDYKACMDCIDSPFKCDYSTEID